jgi:hypothetical protein
MRLIAKMAEDGRAAAALIGEQRTMPAIVHALSTGEDDTRAYTASLLAQLARHEGGAELVLPAMAPLVACVQSSRSQSMQEAGLSALRALADQAGAEPHLLRAGAVPCVVGLLSASPAFTVLEAAADTLQLWCSRGTSRSSCVRCACVRACVVCRVSCVLTWTLCVFGGGDGDEQRACGGR